MATLTTNVVPHGGLPDTGMYDPATAGGDACATGSGVLLHVKNANATTARTVTMTTPGTVDGLAIADRAVPVPISGSVFIPVLDLYRDTTTGLASWTYDTEADLSVAVIRVA